jgi:hypothetical protein
MRRYKVSASDSEGCIISDVLHIGRESLSKDVALEYFMFDLVAN